MTRARTLVLAVALLAPALLGALPGEPPAAGKPRVRRVAITGFQYRPPRVEAAVGDTVEWTNGDIVAHSASADDGKAFDSPDLAPKGVWRTVVRAKGTFAYHCALHPTMKATLVVK